MLEYIFKKLQTFRRATVLKKDSRHRCFPVNIAKFLILFLKNICKRLLFDFFNGSLLHGPKGLRSKLYDGIRFQSPNYRPSFLLLSQHLSF